MKLAIPYLRLLEIFNLNFYVCKESSKGYLLSKMGLHAGIKLLWYTNDI